MLAVQKSRNGEDKCLLNILPCKINYTGPTKVTKRFWHPSTEKDGSRTSYFRGRKLRGRVVNMPSMYQGVVWKHTGRTLPLQHPPKIEHRYANESESEVGEEEDNVEPTKIIEHVSTFDSMLVWGHDQLPSDTDAFVKGVEEWIKFAEAIHKPGKMENTTT